MNAIATIPKLDKLIPLLGSDKDGEALAAARAIGKKLKGAGCDWHDIVTVIKIGTKAQHRPGINLFEANDDLARAQFCFGRRRSLTSVERDFIASILRTLAYGRGLTARQQAWLDKIFAGLGGAA